VRETGVAYQVEPDRARAIAWALAEARPGDAVLIAGKGHEDYQVIGERRLPFDDRLVALDTLHRLGYSPHSHRGTPDTENRKA